MVYIFGVIGFVLGFTGGLLVINLFLKSFTASELMREKSLRWTYGLAVWIFAAMGAYAGVWLYNRSFF